MRFAAMMMAAATLTAILLGSCRKQPDGVLSDEEMALVVADLHIADGVSSLNYSQYPTDSARQALKQSVLAAHGVTQQQLDTSFMWYGAHLDEYMAVCDRVLEILQERQSEIAAGANAQIAIAGDSVDLWPGARHLIGSPRMLSRLLTFSIAPDTNWRAGDIYTLRYKVVNARNRVASRILADYSDGTTAYRDEPGVSQGSSAVKLQLDSTRTPERVYGYIIVDPDRRDYFHLDSISLVRTRRESRPGTFFPQKRFDFSNKAEEPTDTASAAETAPGSPADSGNHTGQPARTDALQAVQPSQRPIPAKSSRRI
ncbi:MAG: DUF4296 domain-containing protein [Muribaculaceae bacterium]|nr:DUF4296 domain-containing protein [Muribaculaceae bacterium]